MSYFKDNYSKIRLPIGEAGSVGLRRCQLGAIHAIASHFTIHKKPAIIAMPTGSGKTAVLLISTFFLRAKRVLVVTPSRLVRNQIAEEFRTLKILKDCNVIEGEIAHPEVIEVTKRITSLSMWQSFNSYDSGLDYLSVGIVTNAIPENIIAVAWDPDIYNNPKRVIYRRTDGEIDHYDLLDLDLVMDIDKTTPDSIGLFVQGPNLRWPFMFFLSGDPFYRLDSEASGRLFIEKTFSTVDFLDYVNEKPPHFFTSDFSRFVRNELFQRSATSDEFPQKQITVIDWASNKVDIMTESEEPPNKDLVSIHKFLENYLASQRHNIIVYDHGTGEIADFITVDEDADGIGFSLYHCKASGKKNPGERVEDFYEVCGQVVKSMIWLNDNDGLARKLRHRTEDLEKCSLFIAGDLAEFNRIVDESKMKQSKYGINLVQPGISRSKLSPKGTQILSAANDYVIAGHCSELIIFASD